jgi:chromate transporter
VLDRAERAHRIGELARLYLRLGLTSFGGPAAHIALMENEVVVRRRWLTHEAFIDLVGATNLIPGPNSTEMAMHLGFLRAGVPGLCVSGVSFILPAALITVILAILYTQYGSLPDAAPFLHGIQAAVIAIIAASAVRLGRTAVKKQIDLLIIGILVFASSLLLGDEILVLLAGGIIGGLWLYFRRHFPTGPLTTAIAVWYAWGTPQLNGASQPESATILKLTLVFLKIGSVLYGSGYVLIALLRDQLINTQGWLTPQQLLDAVAVGQFTPGPVLSTATFIGYQVLGLKGAAAATGAIFFPSFVFVVIVNPLIPRLRRFPLMSAFLDAVNVSSVALIAAVAVQLGIGALREWLTIGIGVASLLAAVRTRLNPAWLVIGGGAVSVLASIMHLG